MWPLYLEALAETKAWGCETASCSETTKASMLLQLQGTIEWTNQDKKSGKVLLIFLAKSLSYPKKLLQDVMLNLALGNLNLLQLVLNRVKKTLR
jgi:hypothetical protein